MFKCLVPRSWTCLEKIMTCGLVEGGMSPGVGCVVQKSTPGLVTLSAATDQDVSSQLLLQRRACLLAVIMVAVDSSPL